MTPLHGPSGRRARQINVADAHKTIDLRTIEEVQRLLATTDFASIDDLARRTDPDQLGRALDQVRPAAHDAAVDSAGLAPLPRRR